MNNAEVRRRCTTTDDDTAIDEISIADRAFQWIGNFLLSPEVCGSQSGEWLCWWLSELISDLVERIAFVLGIQTEIPDDVKAGLGCVTENPAHKLGSRQGHRMGLAVFVAGVGEGDIGFVAREQPMVGNWAASNVASQVGDDALAVGVLPAEMDIPLGAFRDFVEEILGAFGCPTRRQDEFSALEVLPQPG